MGSVVSVVVPALAAVLVVSLLLRRSAKRAAERKRPPSSDGSASYGLPSAFCKVLVGCAVVPIAIPTTISVATAMAGRFPFEQWQADLRFAAFAAFFLYTACYYRTWRFSCDADGLHLRRLLLPDKDFSWDELDSLAGVGGGQGLAITAGGRKRVSFPLMYLSEGDDVSLLREACQSHGVPMCFEEDLPEGVPGPHGLARHGMSDKKKIAIYAIVFVAALVLLWLFIVANSGTSTGR